MPGVEKPYWLNNSAYGRFMGDLDLPEMAQLTPKVVPKGTVLFRPGDKPAGFVLVLSGRVGVFLIGKTGRDLLLYAVEPGETCIQTTMGVLSDQSYNAEAVTETDCSIVIVPKPMFERLMDRSAAFRSFVFAAFGERLADVTHMLEQVAFTAVGTRLAKLLLDRGQNGEVIDATHQELATAIGTSREVVSRRLETMQKQGLVSLDRGIIRLIDQSGISRLAE